MGRSLAKYAKKNFFAKLLKNAKIIFFDDFLQFIAFFQRDLVFSWRINNILSTHEDFQLITDPNTSFSNIFNCELQRIGYLQARRPYPSSLTGFEGSCKRFKVVSDVSEEKHTRTGPAGPWGAEEFMCPHRDGRWFTPKTACHPPKTHTRSTEGTFGITNLLFPDQSSLS